MVIVVSSLVELGESLAPEGVSSVLCAGYASAFGRPFLRERRLARGELLGAIPMASKTLIFVYGSLKRGARHHGQLAGAEFVGSSRSAPGYRLVRYSEGYPALVRASGEDGAVRGELYRVDAEQLGRLDAFEECPTLYQRELIELEDGSSAAAYVIFAEQARGLPSLESYDGQDGASGQLGRADSPR